MIDHSRMETTNRRLVRCLGDSYAAWQVHDIRLAGSGLDSIVFRAESPILGPVALKVPMQRWVAGEMWAADEEEVLFDFREFLRQEKALSEHLYQHQVKVPQVFALHFGSDDFDFLVSEFVDHDDSTPNMHEFGTLIGTLHRAPVPPIPLIWNRGTTIEEVIVRRISERVRVIEQRERRRLPLPSIAELRDLIAWPGQRACCLHMDPRSENILTTQGHVRALIDWTSATIGDPGLEITRVDEYGQLGEDFLRGYGDPDVLTNLPRRVELIYRLDTAAMLAFVFLTLAPDPRQAAAQIHRVAQLIEDLNHESR